MRMVDANMPIYAHALKSPWHAAAKAWFEEQLAEGPRFGIPWPTILAFVRISTNPRSSETPASMAQAWRTVEGWLATPNVWIPEAGPPK